MGKLMNQGRQNLLIYFFICIFGEQIFFYRGGYTNHRSSLWEPSKAAVGEVSVYQSNFFGVYNMYIHVNGKYVIRPQPFRKRNKSSPQFRFDSVLKMKRNAKALTFFFSFCFEILPKIHNTTAFLCSLYHTLAGM